MLCELGGEKKYAIRKMAGKIIINTERCKGCGLCVIVCPKDCIVISKRSNKTGYFPAEATNLACTGCTMCAIICPEAIIEVYRDEAGIVEVNTKPSKKMAQAKSCAEVGRDKIQ